MNCRTCSNPLPEEAVFCPECGVRVAAREVMSRESAVVGAAGGQPAVAESLSVSRQKTGSDGAVARPKVPPSSAQPSVVPPRASVDTLLARANLLRMRGQWAEAVERCTEALRVDPQSAAAHSLLGDVYENQGRLDKASHWYQLALEQNPESIADKAKLARVRELQAVRRRTGDPRFSWAYLVAVAGVAFLFVAFVMAAVVAGDRNRSAPSFSKDTPIPQFPPSAIPRVQPLDHTDEEEQLANYLIARLGSLYVQVVTVTLNQQDHDAIVTARMTGRPIPLGPKGESRRDHLLREGYRIAFLARGEQLEQKHDLQYVTIRVLDRVKGPIEVVWRGRIFARNIAVSDDLASVPEVRSVYISQWWNPAIGF